MQTPKYLIGDIVFVKEDKTIQAQIISAYATDEWTYVYHYNDTIKEVKESGIENLEILKIDANVQIEVEPERGDIQFAYKNNVVGHDDPRYHAGRKKLGLKDGEPCEIVASADFVIGVNEKDAKTILEQIKKQLKELNKTKS